MHSKLKVIPIIVGVFFSSLFTDLELVPAHSNNVFTAKITEYIPGYNPNQNSYPGPIHSSSVVTLIKHKTKLSTLIEQYSDNDNYKNIFIVYACRSNSNGQQTFGLTSEISQQQEDSTDDFEILKSFLSEQDGGAKYTATNERIKLGNRINVVVYKIQGSNKKYIRINKKYVWLKEYKKSHK